MSVGIPRILMVVAVAVGGREGGGRRRTRKIIEEMGVKLDL
jgi:hypothetical protein